MKKILCSLISLALCLTMFTACTVTSDVDKNENSVESSQKEESKEESQEESKEESKDEKIVLIDQADREVVLEKKAEKVVSSYYMSSAILIALGKEDNLVGIEMKADSRNLYKMAAPQFLDLPAIGSGKGINVEETLALEPDLVIVPKKLLDSTKSFEAVDVPVLVVDPESVEDFRECIELIAKATGSEGEAEKLLNYYDETNEKVENLLKDVSEKPSVYLSSSSSLFSTTTSKMYQNVLITSAGGINVSEELEDSYWVDISPEQLIEWNPDFMFSVVDADYSIDDIISDSSISSISAIQNKNVFVVPSSIEPWDYPTPSSVLGLLWMTHTLHPELISKEEYVEEAQDFYQEFFGIEVTENDIGINN